MSRAVIRARVLGWTCSRVTVRFTGIQTPSWLRTQKEALLGMKHAGIEAGLEAVHAALASEAEQIRRRELQQLVKRIAGQSLAHGVDRQQPIGVGIEEEQRVACFLELSPGEFLGVDFVHDLVLRHPLTVTRRDPGMENGERMTADFSSLSRSGGGGNRGEDMRTLRRFLVLLVLMCWQGGFTFYTAVVVPIGTAVLETALAQGWITRQVTVYLNLAGAAALVMLGWDMLACLDPCVAGAGCAGWFGACSAPAWFRCCGFTAASTL